MLMIQAAVTLQNLMSHEATLPVAGGAFAGLAVALFRSPIWPFGVRESESLMNFSSVGTLRCICGTRRSESTGPGHREFCRSCGCEVMAEDRELLGRQVTQREARRLTRDLRDAAIRAGRLELPASITSVAELQKYLSSDAEKIARLKLVSHPVVIQSRVL